MHRLVLLLAAGLALGACGETPRPTTEPRVKLKLDLPDDGRPVRAERVEVHGSVSPVDSAVRVAGKDAEVSAGEFTAQVALVPGSNVIDITATAPGRRPATDAVRVERDTRVEVPLLIGEEHEQAKAALEQAGLTPVEEQGGSWLDRILGGEITVCATSPSAGTLLEKGSEVTVQTGRDC